MILAPLFGVVSRRGIEPRLQCFTRCKVTKHAHIFFYIPLYLAGLFRLRCLYFIQPCASYYKHTISKNRGKHFSTFAAAWLRLVVGVAFVYVSRIVLGIAPNTNTESRAERLLQPSRTPKAIQQGTPDFSSTLQRYTY